MLSLSHASQKILQDLYRLCTFSATELTVKVPKAIVYSMTKQNKKYESMLALMVPVHIILQWCSVLGLYMYQIFMVSSLVQESETQT